MFSLNNQYIIVNYHYVEDPAADRSGIHPCSLGEFERQIKFLSGNFKIVSIPELFASAASKLAGKLCALTFDDGLRGHYDNVLPILKKYGVIGTFFPITSTFEGGVPATHKMHTILSAASPQEVVGLFGSFMERFYPDLKSLYPIPDDHRLYDRRWHEDVLTANFKETMIILSEDIKGRFLRYCFKKFGLNEQSIGGKIFMTKNQVKNLHTQNMVIGSHSHRHYSMGVVEAEFMRRDIKLSKDILFGITGKDVNIFSYSHGHSTGQGVKVLKALGFNHAVTIERRNVSDQDSPFLLPRYDANDVRDFLNSIAQ